MRLDWIRFLPVVSFLLLQVGFALGQENKAGVTKEASAGVRRALIICGLAGDADHRKLFGESTEMLVKGLTTYHGFAAENIRVLWGEKPTDKDPVVVRDSKEIATRETIPATAAALRKELQPEDTLWVFVIGHAHYDGRNSWLNLTGMDLNHLEFGQAFADMACREQVFFITTPCSGYYLKPLAQAGRVVISATEADLEVNETLFPHRLARAIGTPPPIAEFDLDRDDQFTLFDLYLWVTRDTAVEYSAGQLLATEHALIDDTGDGRGTEVQAEYLSADLGGRRRPTAAQPTLPKGDGKFSREVALLLPLSITRPLSPPEPPLPIDVP